MIVQKADNIYKFRYKCIIFTLLAVLILIGGCKNKADRIHSNAQNTALPDAEQSRDYIAVVTGVDAEDAKLFLYNIDAETNSTLDYTGATNFTNKSNGQITAAQLTPGEIVDIYLEEGSEALVKVQVSPDVFEENNIQDIHVNSNESYISFRSQNYRYQIGLAVFSQNKIIDVMEISPGDSVTVRGVMGQVYSIVVEKGHGFLRPLHYTDFIGGKMTIQGEMIINISKNMLIPVREGTHEVTMQKGDFIGTRSIEVVRDGEVEMDMSAFKYVKPEEGQVTFHITPVGALVYVDKKETDILSPVSLKYGKHSVTVMLEGYTTYNGILDVQSANPTVKIDLASEDADIEDGEKSDPKDEQKSSPAPVYDNEHKITVSEPKGAEVYLDGIYKGTAPVSFTKVIGTHTIILSKEGYVTKSYTVSILNDDEDILWNFAALVRKAGAG